MLVNNKFVSIKNESLATELLAIYDNGRVNPQLILDKLISFYSQNLFVDDLRRLFDHQGFKFTLNFNITSIEDDIEFFQNPDKSYGFKVAGILSHKLLTLTAMGQATSKIITAAVNHNEKGKNVITKYVHITAENFLHIALGIAPNEISALKPEIFMPSGEVTLEQFTVQLFNHRAGISPSESPMDVSLFYGTTPRRASCCSAMQIAECDNNRLFVCKTLQKLENGKEQIQMYRR